MARFKFVFLILAALAPVGCDSLPKGFSNDSPQLVAEPDKVSALLADAAGRATNALETLAAVEQARTPRVNVSPVGNAPPELRRAITVNWVGPVEQIAEKLANRAGYEFSVIGEEPPTPIIVTVDTVNQPIINVLRDLGLQLGQRANVRVDGAERLVEVQYPSQDGPAVGIGNQI